MTIVEDLALATSSLHEVIRILQNVVQVYPNAETKLKAFSMAESTEPDVRAMTKCLLALGCFAMAQHEAERTIHALVDAQSTSSSYLN